MKAGPERDAAMLELRLAGWTLLDVAEHFGTNEENVRQAAMRAARAA